MNIEALKAQIVSANKAYRDGHPLMDDQSFDDLVEQLQSIMPFDEFNAFRDTLHEDGGKVKHPWVMGSLDKFKLSEPESVLKFIKALKGDIISISAKVDGISCRLHTCDSFLVSATTRGDGWFGQDITDKIAYVKGIPKKFGVDENDIRGELVILKDDFEELNAKHNGKFANPRNAVAGIMNQKDWDPEDVKHVSFIAYTILGPLYCKDEQFALLKSAGFACAWNILVSKDDILNDISCAKLLQYATQSYPYEADGLVVCAAGYTNEDKYRPDNCVALKPNQQIGETKIVDVVFEGPAKSGVHVPVAIVEPVQLGGATVTRCTLHNLDFIAEKGLKYGSKVKIMRSGDVIPKIIEVVENDEHCTDIELPLVCNCCGQPLVRDGVNLRCMNHDCTDQVVEQIALFIKNIGVKSASNATLKNFGIISFKKLVNFAPDKKYKSQTKLASELYDKMFSRSKIDLLCNMTSFEGLAETTLRKIIDYYASKGQPIDDFVFSCDPNGYVVNENMKDLLIERHGLPEGIGEVTLEKFQNGLQDAWEVVNMIIRHVSWHGTDVIQSASSVKTKMLGSICVTGSLNFGSRSKFLKFAEEHGYESKPGVSKGLTYLITNDASSGSSKNRKAKELGIKVITEAEFMKLVQNNEVECSLDML